MRGLCRDRSPFAAVILTTLVSCTGLSVTTPTMVFASDLTGQTATQTASQRGHEAGHQETEWPLRSFAQPAFKPDYAAMTATIIAEPAPQPAAPTAAFAQPSAAVSNAVPRNSNPVTRVVQQEAAPPVGGPPLRLDTTDAPSEAQHGHQNGIKTIPRAGAKIWNKIWPKTGADAKAEAEAAARPNGDPADAYTAQDIATARAQRD
jgi:hypothetical protein